ncbi:MAG: YafY family protein [Ilumatobacteraceae bacterium]
MRADRLVAILLLLQARGQVTAAEVAEELEISERTARRDLEALGVAGLPVYSMQGRNGGWRLAGGGRTDLSGLNAEEVRALFMVAGPSSQVTPQMKGALRKLLRALPEPMRERAEAASTSLVVDPVAWHRVASERPPPPLLDDVQRAVIDGAELRLGYVARDGSVSERLIHPLGVAAKGTIWYLVAGTEAGQRTFRIDRIRHLEPTGRRLERPRDFDLSEAWASVMDRVEELRNPFSARALVDAKYAKFLRHHVGASAVTVGPSTPDGRVEVEVRGRDAASLARDLVAFAGGLEVLEPEELRAALRQMGEALVAAHPAPTRSG